MNYIEKREMERFDLKLPALLSMIDKSGKLRVDEFMISNISSGGAFFKTHEPLPIGTEVKMDLILPLCSLHKTGGRKTHVDVSGSVIRTDEKGMAVCFDKRYRIVSY